MVTAPEIIIDGFAGPGGWDVAAARLGLSPVVGIEIDAAACATRAAAGHLTIRADISRYPAEALSGRVLGAIFSPVCTTFSAAGKRAGVAVTSVLDASVRDAFAGCRTRAARRREMAAMLRQAWWPSPKLTRAGRSAAIWKAVRSASLVVEPARFIYASRPEWVAMEQVREVLPLWKVYAEELRALGYSAWCGVLNSADYGVPQTRMRAILIASRVHEVWCPPPTHYDPRKGDQLFGEPWVSMAEALGWGATGRPGPAVTLRRDRGSGRSEEYGEREDTPLDRPAPSITAATRGSGPRMQWVLHRDRGAGLKSEGGEHRDRTPDEPAPTITAGSNGGHGTRLAWKFRNNNNNNACERSMDEPAGTLFFGGRSNWAAWVQGPGTDSVRISPAEAAILQSFGPDYPWRGTKTRVFEQIGNAVPPALAEHVLAMAAGVRKTEAAPYGAHAHPGVTI